MASSPITLWQIDGETVETVTDFILRGSKITADGDWSYAIKRRLLLGRKVMINLDSILKSRDITLSTKVHLNQSYGFSSSHVWMWDLDYKEIWALENWCFWTVMLENTLESPLDSKKIQPVHPKGNQSLIYIGRINDEALIIWPPDSKNWFTGKDPKAGKDWRWEVKGMAEGEMVGWPHWLNGHEFEQAPGVGDGQEGLACSPWGRKESPWMSDWTELKDTLIIKNLLLSAWSHSLITENSQN